MSRYFLEISYKGTDYSGFQTQENAVTIQSEVEKAIAVLQRVPVSLTGSSRTDAGVHALQNYFHFDFEGELHPQFVYKLNAILPRDIVLHQLIPMGRRRIAVLMRSAANTSTLSTGLRTPSCRTGPIISLPDLSGADAGCR